MRPGRVCVGVMLGWTLAAGAPAQELVVGQVAPIKVANSVGNQLRRGALLYLESVNRSGGVHGKALRLVSRHREVEAADSVARTRQLLDEARPIALLNLMGTGSMEALVRDKLIEREGIPVVGIRTGSTSLHQPTHPWLFHTRANYDAEIRKVLAHFKTIGVRRIALVHEGSPFGKQVQRLANARMREANAGFAAELSVHADAPDLPAAVATLSAAPVDAVLVAASSAVTADLYRAVREKGVSAHVIALSTVDGTQVVKRIGARSAHGLGIAQVIPNPAAPSMQVSREFQQALRAAQAPEADLNQASLEGFIAAKVLVEGLRRAGPNPTRAALRQALEGMSEFDAGGFVVSFSRSSHSGSQHVDIAIVGANGKLLR